MRNLKVRIILVMLAAMLIFAPATLAAEAGPGPLAALGINPGLLIAQIVNFVIVVGLLTFGMWTPLQNMMDERSNTIEKGLQDAQEAANARRNAEAEAEKIRTDARAEIQKSIEEGRVRGDELAASIRSEAQAEAEKIREEARANASNQLEAELAGLRNQVANISVALANRLIGESLMDEKSRKGVISDFFSRVPDGAKSISGDVTVVSAMPLEDSEKANIEKELSGANVSYQVDPNILGGLVIRGEDRVVDGSVRSSMNELSGRLQ